MRLPRGTEEEERMGIEGFESNCFVCMFFILEMEREKRKRKQSERERKKEREEKEEREKRE